MRGGIRAKKKVTSVAATRVLIADSHEIFKASLKEFFSRRGSEFEVVGEAADGPGAVEKAKKLSPHLVVMDLRLPRLNSIDATRAIVAATQARVLMLAHKEDCHLAGEAIRAGAGGFVLKCGLIAEFSTALEAMLAGKAFVSPRVPAGCLERPTKGDKAIQTADADAATISVFAVLTPRQREVLQSIADGGTTKTIAKHLNIAIRTVETHRWKIMKKLNLHNTADLTKYAIKHGITNV